MGQALFAEYESLLERTSVWSRSLITKQERETLWRAYLSVCRWVRVYYLWRPNLPDESDNHLTRLGRFHAEPIHTGSDSSWHQGLRDLLTRIPSSKEAFGEG